MKCMVCKGDFESLVEFAGKTVCDGCYDRPIMVKAGIEDVVNLIYSYLKDDNVHINDTYSKLKEYSSDLLFEASCICYDRGVYAFDLIGGILSKRGDESYEIFVKIIDTEVFQAFGYWMRFSNMSDDLKCKLGLLYNNALRANAIKNSCFIDFLFGVI